MDIYIYAAVFEPCNEGGYSVYFPDLPGCITEGNDLREAMNMAKEALELHLWGMEDDNEPIPVPSAPEEIEVEKTCFTVPIEADMPLIRNEMANKAVKKTLTIPYWMNKIAESKKINFSQILQVALKEKLGIKDYK